MNTSKEILKTPDKFPNGAREDRQSRFYGKVTKDNGPYGVIIQRDNGRVFVANKGNIELIEAKSDANGSLELARNIVGKYREKIQRILDQAAHLNPLRQITVELSLKCAIPPAVVLCMLISPKSTHVSEAKATTNDKGTGSYQLTKKPEVSITQKILEDNGLTEETIGLKYSGASSRDFQVRRV